MALLTQKYEEMKANVANDYHNSSFTEKGLGYVNVTEVAQTDDELLLVVESGTGKKGLVPGPGPGIDGPFNAGNDWYYGKDKGHCEWDFESDAAQQLMIAMNNEIPDPNGNYFFINLNSVTKKGGNDNVRRDNDPGDPDNDFDYYLYSSRTDITGFEDDMLCLYVNEMNIYYSYLQHLVYTKIPNEDFSPGYSIESVVDIDGSWEWTDPSNKHYFHEGIFQFGIKVGFADSSEIPSEL
jgi:hypothetical protein